jgi:lipopolysaccharide/colanic/teichoic acid biosynthesis glycosyltransferase
MVVQNVDQRFGPLRAQDADRRIIRVGRFLRATAMDEPPQVWNILRGDRSFVAPRALLPAEVEVNGSGELIPMERPRGTRCGTKSGWDSRGLPR